MRAKLGKPSVLRLELPSNFLSPPVVFPSLRYAHSWPMNNISFVSPLQPMDRTFSKLARKTSTSPSLERFSEMADEHASLRKV